MDGPTHVLSMQHCTFKKCLLPELSQRHLRLFHVGCQRPVLGAAAGLLRHLHRMLSAVGLCMVGLVEVRIVQYDCG